MQFFSKTNIKRRMLSFYGKVVRGDGSPGYIARGWALGMFVGCSIPIFMQLIIAIPLAFLIRGSKIGAALGTMLTNPVTVVVIYPLQCWIGNRIIGGSLDYDSISRATMEFVRDHDVDKFLGMGRELLCSFFAGGLCMALVLTPVTYFLVLTLVIRYRNFRAKHPGGLRIRINPSSRR